MKYLFLLSCLFLGCSIEPADNFKEQNNIENTSNDNEYSYNTPKKDTCPPPQIIIVIINNKPTEQLIIEPCYTGNNKNTISDKDWGTSEDHEFWLPQSLPNIKSPPPGDPIP